MQGERDESELPPWHAPPPWGGACAAGPSEVNGSAVITGAAPPRPWDADQEPRAHGMSGGAAPPDAGDDAAGIEAAVRQIWEWGGWDARMAPHETWVRVHGRRPFPDAAAWATVPTFGPLDPYIRDDAITDVHLNMPGAHPIVRRNGDRVELEVPERWHPAWMPWLVQQCLARGHSTRQADHVIEGVAHATLPGERPCMLRYLIALPPLCPHGPALVIRFLRPGRLQLARLVELQTLTPEMGELLVRAMRANIDLYLVGAPGSGKTTLMQALIDAAADQRLVCLEDIPELTIPPARAVRLLPPRDEPQRLTALVRMTLRMNPHRVVIGEVRGGEAYAALLAGSNGFPVVTTLHGDHAAHGIHTLSIKAAQAPEVHGRIEAVYAMLNARPALVVSLTRRSGRRQVSEIAEVVRQSGNARPIVETIYLLDDQRWQQVAPLSAALQRALEHDFWERRPT